MRSSDTTIYLASVTDTRALAEDGTFFAVVEGLGGAELPILYASPFATRTKGGIIAIPTDGQKVLVASPAGSQDLYYIGATFWAEYETLTPVANNSSGPTGSDKPNLKPPILRVDRRLYSARGKPMRHMFKGVRGGGLAISEEYNPKFYNIYTKLDSPRKKHLSLIDSPKVDSIVLETEHRDGIRIAALPDKGERWGVGPRSIKVRSVGNQTYSCKHGETELRVMDGKELNILNYSNGSHAPVANPDHFGNINLETRWNDVNIRTRKEDGRIFIECVDTTGSNQIIDIETNGTGGCIIKIKSNKIELHADNNGIDIQSKGDINMQSDGNIRLTATQNIDLQGGPQIAADASLIHLNSGASNAATPDIQVQESFYENEGVKA